MSTHMPYLSASIPRLATNGVLGDHPRVVAKWRLRARLLGLPHIAMRVVESSGIHAAVPAPALSLRPNVVRSARPKANTPAKAAIDDHRTLDA
jgi:hypothetical protein